MLNKIFAIMLFVFLFTSPVLASEDNAIFFGVVTTHFDQDSDLNESNDIVGIKYNHFFASTFENSHYERSHFLGYYWDTKHKYLMKDLYVKGNLYLGALYGYGDAYLDLIGGWASAALPTAEIGYKRVSLEFMVMPFDGGVATALFNIHF